MQPYLAEFIGTLLLTLLGGGVVANVLLKGTKGHDSGWIVITAGWGLAVFVAVLCVADVSGAHINPAVTIGLAAAGKFPWAEAPGYIVAQMLGAFAGAVLVFLLYRDHYLATDDVDAKLGTFATEPAIRNLPVNLLCEIVATFVLVFAVLHAGNPTSVIESTDLPAENVETVKVGLGAPGAIPVGLTVVAIGLCLGGLTGYAINPARDLGPRIAHALLPIGGGRDSDWSYAWVPVVGPILGGLAAAALELGLG